MSEFSFSWSSALRVTPAVTRLTVNRRLYNTGAVVLGRQMGQRRSMIFDDFLLNLNDVLLSVSRSVTFEGFI